MRYVLFYDSADDLAAKLPAHLVTHRAWMDRFHDRGDLLMIGPFGNPQEEGSMAVFATREAAEEFAKGDPFVLHGVVKSWRVLDWHQIYGEG
jgi:uncharacterized protein YciI